MPVPVSDFGLSIEQLREKYTQEELMQTFQLLRGSSGSAPSPSTPANIKPYDPSKDFFSADNLGSMAGNVVPSAINMGSSVMDAVSSPVRTARAVADQGIGGIFNAIGDRYGSVDAIKRTMVEDPVGMASDVIPGAGAAARFGGKALRGVGRAAKSGTAFGIGITSGRGAERSRAVIDAAAAGKTEPVLRGTRGTDTIYDLGNDAAGAIKDVERAAGAEKGAFLDAADAAGSTVDISGLKQSLLGNLQQGGAGGTLQQLGIKVTPSVNPNANPNAFLVRSPQGSGWFELQVSDAFKQASAGRFENAVLSILNKPDTVPVRALDDIKVHLGKVSDADPAANRVIETLRSEVRKQLGPVAVGGKTYDEAIAPIAQFKERADVLTDKLGTPRLTDVGRQDVNPMQLGEALGRSFNPSGAMANRVEALDEINDMIPGQNIKERAAGIGFSSSAPAGLVERGQFMNTMRTVLGGAVGGMTAAGGLNPATAVLGAAALPLFMPQTAVRMLVGVGLAERQAMKVSAVVRAAAQKAEQFGINPRSMTVAQLLERVDEMERQRKEQKQRQGGIMGRIGTASPAFSR